MSPHPHNPPIEIVGLVYHARSTEWRSLPPSTFDRPFIVELAQAFERAGYDRVLLGQTATWPDNLAIASTVAAVTTNLKLMIAQRPGFIAPAVAARKLATIDQLSRGRAGVHIITAASDIETQCDGDFLTKDERYVRSYEYVGLLRQLWASDKPVHYTGQHFTLNGAAVDIKPYNGKSIPIFWGGGSPNAVKFGAERADVYALGPGTVADTAAQVARIQAEADLHGRKPRYSMSMRVLVADTDDAAWARAHQLLDDVIVNQERNGPVGRVKEEEAREGAVARKLAAMDERLDDCLWMGVTKVTQGRLQATALVGSPETVANALMAYYEIGITNFLITGFDPLPDTALIGKTLIPLLREKVKSATYGIGVRS
ncbi:MAG: LLM class flavin-dependent oxidoreductase [Rhodospirillaceae bacterium]|nr:LLM class flavin-dependent oxidoreductase [Rhodospirillaceae bacterium]